MRKSPSARGPGRHAAVRAEREAAWLMPAAGLQVGVSYALVYLESADYPQLAAHLGLTAPGALSWLPNIPYLGFTVGILAMLVVANTATTRVIQSVRNNAMLAQAAGMLAMAFAPGPRWLGVATCLTAAACAVCVVIKLQAVSASRILRPSRPDGGAGMMNGVFLAVLAVVLIVPGLFGLAPARVDRWFGGVPPANALLVALAMVSLAGWWLLPGRLDRGSEKWASGRGKIWNRAMVRANLFAWANAAAFAPLEQGIVGLLVTHRTPHPVLIAGLATATFLPAAMLMNWWERTLSHSPRHQRLWELLALTLLLIALLAGILGLLLGLAGTWWILVTGTGFTAGEISTAMVWTAAQRTAVAEDDVRQVLILDGGRYLGKALLGWLVLTPVMTAAGSNLAGVWSPGLSASVSRELARVWIPSLVVALASIAFALWNPTVRRSPTAWLRAASPTLRDRAEVTVDSRVWSFAHEWHPHPQVFAQQVGTLVQWGVEQGSRRPRSERIDTRRRSTGWYATAGDGTRVGVYVTVRRGRVNVNGACWIVPGRPTGTAGHSVVQETEGAVAVHGRRGFARISLSRGEQRFAVFVRRWDWLGAHGIRCTKSRVCEWLPVGPALGSVDPRSVYLPSPQTYERAWAPPTGMTLVPAPQGVLQADRDAVVVKVPVLRQCLPVLRRCGLGATTTWPGRELAHRLPHR